MFQAEAWNQEKNYGKPTELKSHLVPKLTLGNATLAVVGDITNNN